MMMPTLAANFHLPKPGFKAVGYSILRIGDGEKVEFCLACPHVDKPEFAELNSATNALELTFSSSQISLGQMPQDLMEALRKRPSSVMLVSVDTLTRPRFSAKVSELLSAGRQAPTRDH
jgi:hypothetical protein